MNGRTWHAPNGKTYQEVQLQTFTTEAQARTAAESMGATLNRERMTGAYYFNPETGASYRITRASWHDGYVLYGTREVSDVAQ